MGFENHEQKDLQRSYEQGLAFNSLGRKVSASLSMKEVVKAALDEVVAAISPDLALLYLLKDDKLILLDAFSGNNEWHGREVKTVGSCLCGLAAEGAPVYAGNILLDSRCVLNECKEAGLISDDTMTLVSRVKALMDYRARDVMVPLSRVVMVEEGAAWPEYLETFRQSQFSRFPVYRGDRQNVVGFVSIRSVLKARRPTSQGVKMDEAYIVDGYTPIVEMMVRMKSQGGHMAMVHGESDELPGMATLEDILERLVGAIADEFH